MCAYPPDYSGDKRSIGHHARQIVSHLKTQFYSSALQPSSPSAEEGRQEFQTLGVTELLPQLSSGRDKAWEGNEPDEIVVFFIDLRAST
jgi:hypothetical protein